MSGEKAALLFIFPFCCSFLSYPCFMLFFKIIIIRFTGTIVGVVDNSPQWSESKWRSLKIQWDEPATIQRPERVSAWEVEPFVPSASLDIPTPALKSKRPRPIGLPLSETATSSTAASFWYQGSTTALEVSPLSNTTEIQNSESQTVCPPKQKDVNNNIRTRADGIWPGSLNLFRESMEKNKNISARSILSDYASPASSRAGYCHILDQVEKGKKSETSTVCRLFGIDLRNNSNKHLCPKKEVAYSNVVTNGPSETASEADKARDRDQAKEKKFVKLEAAPKEKISKQGCTTSMRTRTKVQMQGVAVGRAVDLTVLEGYEDLITELEKMFQIKGELHARNKWEVVYSDEDGDMMLVGDDPWQEFCKIVRKIFIYTSEEVKKMNPRCKLPLSSLEAEGTIVNQDSKLNSEA